MSASDFCAGTRPKRGDQARAGRYGEREHEGPGEAPAAHGRRRRPRRWVTPALCDGAGTGSMGLRDRSREAAVPIGTSDGGHIVTFPSSP